MGLAPYIFTRSSHISFTLTLALPIWTGSIVFSIKNQYNRLFAHLVPRGTPVAKVSQFYNIDNPVERLRIKLHKLVNVFID